MKKKLNLLWNLKFNFFSVAERPLTFFAYFLNAKKVGRRRLVIGPAKAGAFLFSHTRLPFPPRPLLPFGRILPAAKPGWPVIGPTTVRTSLGWVGDVAMNPITYYAPSVWIPWSMTAGRSLANMGSVLENYESIRRIAVEPYLAVRSAYVQSSRSRIPHDTPSAISEQNNKWVGY